MSLITRSALIGLLLAWSCYAIAAQGLPAEKLEPSPTPAPAEKIVAEPIKDLSTPPTLSDAEKKQLDANRKNQQKATERERKERWKRPAQVEISAPAGRIRPFILQRMSQEGYFLRDDTPLRMVFTKEMKGFKGALTKALIGNAYSGPPIFEIDFVTSESQGVTTVVADMSLTIQNAFGRTDRNDFNRDKDSRSNMDSFLYALKSQAENP
jgi:hypothetical protein